MSYIIRIVAPHFVAGVVTASGRVWRYPPILKFMANWPETDVVPYARSKYWKVQVIPLGE